MKVFTSNIGSGNANDFVGRTVTNLRTLSEPLSYFGVDLGPGRRLLPTAYTVRNRNSTSHVCLSWRLEASIDKVFWYQLDTRVFYVGDPNYDAQYEEVVERLCEPGFVSTWGVNTEIYREVGMDGFQFFRVV